MPMNIACCSSSETPRVLRRGEPTDRRGERLPVAADLVHVVGRRHRPEAVLVRVLGDALGPVDRALRAQLAKQLVRRAVLEVRAVADEHLVERRLLPGLCCSRLPPLVAWLVSIETTPRERARPAPKRPESDRPGDWLDQLEIAQRQRPRAGERRVGVQVVAQRVRGDRDDSRRAHQTARCARRATTRARTRPASASLARRTERIKRARQRASGRPRSAARISAPPRTARGAAREISRCRPILPRSCRATAR